MDCDMTSMNGNHNKSVHEENTYRFAQPWTVQLVWSLLFGTMILTAIIGNCMIIAVISVNRSMRSVTNYFLLNLSVTDLLSVCINATFNYLFMLTGNWPFGHLFCIVNNFMANCLVAVSVFTLTAISIDRLVPYIPCI